MQVVQADYMTQLLTLTLPGDPKHWGRLSAWVKVTQPCGYSVELDGDLRTEGKQAKVRIHYPLMDDGAYEQIEGPASSLLFDMGATTFTVEISSDGAPIVSETAELDQDQLFANSSKGRLRDDFPPGFIECAPLRPVCIDHDEVPVTIRLKTERVPACRVRLDVTARRGTESLVDPVELDLTEKSQVVRFQHAGWDRGEYWVRVQLVEDGKASGPYMVRKFWKEVMGPDVVPEPPLKLGDSVEYMCDGWLFEDLNGIDFWPMSYDPNPDKPAIAMEKPWEFGMIGMEAPEFDAEAGLYKTKYKMMVEVYHRRGYDWHLLADDLDSDDDLATLERLESWLRRSGRGRSGVPAKELRRIDIGVKKEKLDPMAGPYGELLEKLLAEGIPVQEYNIPPLGFSYAILNDPRPNAERNTDHVMLAVPGMREDGALPDPREIDGAQAQIFEMWPEDLNRPNYVCLATSKDGVEWEKPEVGRVEFHGSKANNILGTFEEFFRERNPQDVTAAFTLGITTPKFKFRKYDPKRDGPVDIDKMFMAQISEGRNSKVDFMWPDDFEDSKEELGFTPMVRSYYPMMYKGDNEYLFLSDKPLIHMGGGMDLMHSTETIRHQVERVDEPTIFWYYRPNTPGYAPHCATWDNHQGQMRNLAVMWTDDGVNFRKLACLGVDEFDPPGMQYYGMELILEHPACESGRTMLRRTSSSGVAVKREGMYVATVRAHPAMDQTQYPELIWSRDLLHWHRFTDHRAPLVKLRPDEGAYNWGMNFGGTSYYSFRNRDGNETWGLVNTASTGRHHHVSIGTRHRTLKGFQALFPHYSDTPFFKDWDTLWQRAKRQSYTPLITHIKPGRLAYAAPKDGSGEFTTHPIHFEAEDLIINAQVEAGSLRAEVQDNSGGVIEGYALGDSDAFTGDEVNHRPSWSGRGLGDLSGRILKFRFVLESAKFFAMNLV